MADQYGNQAGQTDEYGNPIPRPDVYGNPGNTGAGVGHQQHGLPGMLQRSGSSSSSSSEDDGHGGRRKKKGLKDKIKEKLPGVGGGGHKQHTHDTATTPPGTGGYGYSGGELHEKKGVMDKIKEKLPGQH